MVATTLKNNQIVQVKSTEPSATSKLTYKAPTLESHINYRMSSAVYSADALKEIQYNEWKQPYVYKGGDTLIKNEHADDLIVAGPSRYTTFKSTTEEPLAFYTLQKDEKVALTSKDGLFATVYALDELKRGAFSVVQRRAGEVTDLTYMKEVNLQSGLGWAYVGDTNSALFQNNTSTPLFMYGANRSVKFEKFDGELFTIQVLEPGMKLKVKTKLNLQDYTKRGSIIVGTSGSVKSFDFGLSNEWGVDLAKGEEI